MRLVIPDLQPGRTHLVQVRAVGNESSSEWSSRYSLLVVNDVTLPKAPTNLTWVVSGDTFAGAWDAVTQNTANEVSTIVRYEIELTAGAITKIVSVSPTTGSQIFYNLPFEENRSLFVTPQAAVGIRVRAVDNTDLKSAWATIVNAANPNPAVPTSVTAVAGLNQIALSWNPPADLDLIGYNVYNGVTKLTFTNATTFIWPTTTYTATTLSVRAVDKFMNESTVVNANTVTPVSPFTADTTAPAVPTALAAPITNNASGVGARAAVTWTMASPPSDLAGFYLRWRKVGDTNYSSTTFDKDALAGIVELQSAFQNYEFQIRAFDWQNNYSAYSSTVTVTSPSNSAPANVTGFVSTPGRDAIRYDWTAVADTDLKEYEVTFSTHPTFVSGNTTFKTAGTTLTVSGLTPLTTYYARIKAVDTSGLVSAAWSSTDTEATLSAGSGVSVSDLSGGAFGAIGMSLPVGSSLLINGGYIKSNTYTGTTQATNPSAAGFYLGNDGLRIDSGIIDAAAMKAGSAVIGDLIIGRSADALGEIKSYGYVANTAGFRLHKTGLEINNGVIKAAALLIQNGQNIIGAPYADFEANPAFYTAGLSVTNAVNSIITTTPQFNTQALNVVRGASAAAFTTILSPSNVTYNMVIEPSTAYIVTAYVRNRSAVSTNVAIGIKWSNGTSAANTPITPTVSSSTWTRITYNVTSPAGVTGALVYLTSSTTTSNAQFDVDGVQVEKQESALTTPSNWTPPGGTSIDGAMIRTGSMRSTDTAMVTVTRPVYNDEGEITHYADPLIIADPNGRPAWLIDAEGDAEFSNLSIRGNAIMGDPDVAGTLPDVVTFVVDRTNASAVLTNGVDEPFKQADVGLSITGTGIPGGTTIIEWLSNSSVRMSANATSTASAFSVNVTRTKKIVSSLSSANYNPGVTGWTVRSDGYAEFRELAADSVDARVLSSNAVSGEHLDGFIDVKSTMKFGENITLSHTGGIVINSPNGETKFPTDGSNTILAGDVEAHRLTVYGNMSVQGTTNEVAKGSYVVLSNGTTAPKLPPNGYSSWEMINTQTQTATKGIATSPRGAGFFVVGYSGSNQASFYEITATGSGYDIGLGAEMDGWNSVSGGRTEIKNVNGGLTRVGSHVFMLCQTTENNPTTGYGRWFIYKIQYNSGVWTYSNRYEYNPHANLGSGTTNKPAIGRNEDGTKLLVAQTSITGNPFVVNYSLSVGVPTFVNYKNLLNQAGTIHSAITEFTSINAGVFDFGDAVERIMITKANDGFAFSWLAGTYSSNYTYNSVDHFSLGTTAPKGQCWDDDREIFMTKTQREVINHTGFGIHEPDSVDFLLDMAHTWKIEDATGPDYASAETTPSDITTITMYKRSSLYLSPIRVPWISTDATSPDGTNIYIAKSGDPLWLNAMGDHYYFEDTIRLDNIVDSGTEQPPTVNTFTESNPGQIMSIAVDPYDWMEPPLIELNGDGSWRLGHLAGTVLGANANDTGWTSITLSNGYTATAAPNAPAYRKIDEKIFFRGGIAKGTAVDGAVAFTLPADFCPVQRIIVTLDVAPFGAAGRGLLNPDGTVELSLKTGTPTSWFLDGLSGYPLD